MAIDQVCALVCKAEFGSYRSLYMNDGGIHPSSDSNIFKSQKRVMGAEKGSSLDVYGEKSE